MPTALQTTIEAGNAKSFRKALAKLKTDPQWTDEKGLSPLHYAAYFGKTDFIKSLLAQGADPNLRSGKLHSTPLQWATYCGIKNAPRLDFKSNSAAIAALLEGGATYDILSAVANQDLAQVKKILKTKPAQANSRWGSGFAPLHVNANIEIGALLLQKKADVNQRAQDGTTPLIKLCGKLHADARLVQLYLEHGARVNDQNDSGRTALHAAIRRGHIKIVQLLLASGADETLRNKKGESPMGQARRMRKRALIPLLTPD